MTIEDQVARDLNTDDNGSQREKQAQRHGGNAPVSNTLNPAAQFFMTDLLDAQQRLISAQHQVLHDGNTAALAKAQLDVIGVQSSVLMRMGVFG